MIRLGLIEPVADRAPQGKAVPFPYSGPILDVHYLPGRGILYSFLLHEVVFFGLLFLSVSSLFERSRPPDRIMYLDLKKPLVFYLPNLAGGDSGDSRPKEKTPEPRKPEVAARSGKGLVYPGPQPIRSDFPEPTNRIQTLLRPNLRNLPILPPPLALPNIVQMPNVAAPLPPTIEARTDLVAAVRASKPAMPAASAPNVAVPAPPSIEARTDLMTPMRTSRLTMPVVPMPNVPVPAPPTIEARTDLVAAVGTPKVGLSTAPAPNVAVPAPPTIEARTDLVGAVGVPRTGVRTASPAPNVALPAPPTIEARTDLVGAVGAPRVGVPTSPSAPNVAVPAPPTIEARTDLVGAVNGPRMNLRAAAEPEASKPVEPVLALSPTPAPADKPATIPAGEARGRFAIGPEPNLNGSDPDAGSPGGASSAAAGPDRRTGPANGGVSVSDNAKDKTAAGPGNGSGISNGAGSKGTGSGDGATPGRGAGPGTNPFPGITIAGGNTSGTSDGSSGRSSTPPSTPPTPRTPYGISIVTSGASGGGLPSLGVFANNEEIHTAYLDMKWPNGKTAPTWTFEYAVIPKSAVAAAPAAQPKPGQPNEIRLGPRRPQGLVLPYPVEKEQPVLPPDLVEKYLQQQVIVYGVLKSDGKMEQLTIKETPDPKLNALVLAALSKWSFRPAQLNGEDVAVKVLLGFRLALPE